MFVIWIIVGSIAILSGIFNKQVLRLLHLQPMSEVFTTPNLKNSSRIIEQIGRVLVITLGISFLIQGLGTVLPGQASHLISFIMLGLSGFLLFTMFGIAVVNWKAK
jgi:hypothetical protein